MKKIEPIRWGVERAASEFKLNPRTVSQRIKRAGILPGQDGCFSTAQIAAALFGDLEAEKIRKTRAEADLAELEVTKEWREVISAELVDLAWAHVAMAIRRVIVTSSLPRDDQDLILREIQSALMSEVLEGLKKEAGLDSESASEQTKAG